MLDAQSGETTNTRHTSYKRSGGQFIDAIPNQEDKSWWVQETGGASRFFYQAKASRSERTCDGEVENGHPTVKPVALLEYLARLTKTPTGGTVLDPFMGSGTTGIACVNEGRAFIGIEIDSEYMEIARRRIAYAQERAKEAQQLELL